jgi:CheY-like chemotaxis protein
VLQIDVNFGLCTQNNCGITRARESLSDTRVILCVDDEAAALAVRCLLLSSAGYEVLTAADGAAALEIFRSIQVDLVITDYRLPRLTGTQLAAEMKRLKPAVPIVLFSGLVEAPLGSEHADLVMTKGMPPVEFLREVGKLIQNDNLRSAHIETVSG